MIEIEVKKQILSIIDDIRNERIVISNLKLQSLIIEWYLLYKDGKDTSKLDYVLLKEFKKASIYRLHNENAYQLNLEQNKLYVLNKAYRTKVLDILDNKLMLPDYKVIDIDDGKLNDIGEIVEAFKTAIADKFVGSRKNYNYLYIPLFTKSGANRVVVSKYYFNDTKQINLFSSEELLDEVIKSWLLELGMDKWYKSKGKTIKALSKIGIILFRQGVQFVSKQRYIKTMIIDDETMDGTVALFRPYQIRNLMKQSNYNISESFQGTLFKPGLFAKGMFSEVPNAMFNYYTTNSGVNCLLNIANCFGNDVLNLKPGDIIHLPIEYFLIHTTSVDYKPKARLSPQFVVYQIDMTKDVSHLQDLILKEMQKKQEAKLVDNDYIGRSIKYGFPEDFYLWDYNLEQNRNKVIMKQLLSIKLNTNGLGSTVKLVGVNPKSIEQIVKKFDIPNLDINKVLLVSPRTFKELGGTKEDIFIEVKGYKNPIMPLKNQVNDYVAIKFNMLKGSSAICSSMNAHRIAVSGDYDGDDIVLFRSDLNIPLNNFDDYEQLSDIRIESSDIVVKNVNDLLRFFAYNLLSGVGKSEVTMDFVWSVANKLGFKLYKADRWDLSKHRITSLLNIDLGDVKYNVSRWAKQVQAYIDIKKKHIEDGLEDGFDYLGDISKRYGLDWQTQQFTTLRRIYKRYVINAPKQEIMKKMIKSLKKMIDKYDLPLKNLIDKPTDLCLSLNPYKEKKWTIKGNIYDIIEGRRITKIVDLQLRYLISTYAIEQNQKLWNTIDSNVEFRNNIIKMTDLYKQYDSERKQLNELLKTIDEYDEAKINSIKARLKKLAFNKFLIVFNLIDYVYETYEKQYNKYPDLFKYIWLYVGYKVHPALWLKSAPGYIIEELANYHNKLIEDGIIKYK